MLRWERPRFAVLNPLLNLVIAATLLVAVASSIVVQPPESGDADTVARAVAWLRALLFTGGSAGLLLALIAYARVLPASQPEGQAPTDDVSGLMSHPGSWRRPYDDETPAPYTLIALGESEDDARAIVDFPDAGTLLAALRSWRWEHPDECLLVFDARGRLIARRKPAPAPRTASLPPRGTFRRRTLALGGAR